MFVSRHAPLRSMTRIPCSSASGAYSRDCSWGVARNSTSTPRSFSSSHEKGSIFNPADPLLSTSWGCNAVSEASCPDSALPRNTGGRPFSRGWCSRSRASSAPAYPLTPRTAVCIEFAINPVSLTFRVLRRRRVCLDGQSSANHLFQSVAQHRSPLLVRTDNKDGVVAGNGPHHLAPVLVVDCESHRLRAAIGCNQYQLIQRLLHLQPEAGQHLSRRRQIVVFFVRPCPVAVRQRITVRTFVQMHLVNIPRERSLGHIEAAPNQLPAQLILAGDGHASHQFPNRIVPIVFRQNRKSRAIKFRTRAPDA